MAAAAKQFRVTVRQQRDGYVLVTSESPVCMSRAPTEREALDRIRAEIRYRLEFCPCSGVDDDFVQLDVVRE